MTEKKHESKAAHAKADAEQAQHAQQSRAGTANANAAHQPKGDVPGPITDALANLNAATDQLAVYVRTLQQRVSTQMTQADVDSVKSGLDQVAARLEGLAKDPHDPVPDNPPAPVP
jgi:hypothetical protein